MKQLYVYQISVDAKVFTDSIVIFSRQLRITDLM